MGKMLAERSIQHSRLILRGTSLAPMITFHLASLGEQANPIHDVWEAQF